MVFYFLFLFSKNNKGSYNHGSGTPSRYLSYFQWLYPSKENLSCKPPDISSWHCPQTHHIKAALTKFNWSYRFILNAQEPTITIEILVLSDMHICCYPGKMELSSHQPVSIWITIWAHLPAGRISVPAGRFPPTKSFNIWAEWRKYCGDL